MRKIFVWCVQPITLTQTTHGFDSVVNNIWQVWHHTSRFFLCALPFHWVLWMSIWPLAMVLMALLVLPQVWVWVVRATDDVGRLSLCDCTPPRTAKPGLRGIPVCPSRPTTEHPHFSPWRLLHKIGAGFFFPWNRWSSSSFFLWDDKSCVTKVDKIVSSFFYSHWVTTEMIRREEYGEEKYSLKITEK